ncbi:MAG: hypothetical protein M1405_02035 [Patescibacteria group bacterium]|nr:hypothetical protein [Patescibacteria group bacterium]
MSAEIPRPEGTGPASTPSKDSQWRFSGVPWQPILPPESTAEEERQDTQDTVVWTKRPVEISLRKIVSRVAHSLLPTEFSVFGQIDESSFDLPPQEPAGARKR